MDLSLPRLSPSTLLRFDDWRGVEDLPLAIYSLHNTTEEDLRNVIQATENEDLGVSVRLAPRWNFSGEKARAVYNEHLRLSKDAESVNDLEFHPYIFVVSLSNDFETDGVMLVTLNREGDCRIHPLRIEVSEVASVMANINIANMNWDEFDAPEMRPVAHRNAAGRILDDSDNEDDYGDDSDDENDESLAGIATKPWIQATNPQDYPKQNPWTKFFIAVYAREGIDIKTLLLKLESPQNHRQGTDSSDVYSEAIGWSVRYQGDVGGSSASEADLIDEACRKHPMNCVNGPRLNKNFFIVVASRNYIRDGVFKVHLNWNGITQGKSQDEITQAGTRASKQIQRSEAETMHGNWERSNGVVWDLFLIGNSHKRWTVDHWLFACFRMHEQSGEAEGDDSNSVDPAWGSRGHGQDRVYFAELPAEHRNPGSDDRFNSSWPTIIEVFLRLCQRRRFDQSFSRQYFIVLDKKTPGVDGVLLVKLNWEFKLAESMDDDQLKSLGLGLGELTLHRCPVKEAHKTLSAFANGEEPWDGVPLS